MVNMRDYLAQEFREEMPDWLNQEKEWEYFPREAFFGSRVVFYPGSGTDGHPVRVFGSSHAAHCFVYVDYMVPKKGLEHTLQDHSRKFRGYDTLYRLLLQESDLVPSGWRAHIDPQEAMRAADNSFAKLSKSPFGFLEILERNKDLTEEHGPRRLAILFLGADGIASYDALFCQGSSVSAPFAAVLQDHGFGGNYDRFGQDGLLERIAIRCDVFPKLLLVAQNTKAWQGYERVPGVSRSHSTKFLYAKREECECKNPKLRSSSSA